MTEFENQNSCRNYPFVGTGPILSSDGAEFPTDVIVDAVVYPLGADGNVVMTDLNPVDGTISFSDEAGSIEIVGTIEGSRALLYQDDYYAGTVVFGPGLGRERKAGRSWSFDGIVLSAACVCSVPGPRVFDIGFDGVAKRASGSLVCLYGRKRIRCVLGKKEVDGVDHLTMRFDFTPKSIEESSGSKDARNRIRKIVFVRKAGSPFGVSGSPYSRGSAWGAGVFIWLRGMSREDLCYQVNASDETSVVADVCPDEEPTEGCPAEEPDPEGKDKAFQVCGGRVYVTSSDAVGYRTPLKVDTVNGIGVPNTPKMQPVMQYDDAMEEVEKLTQAQLGYGNGIKIGFPGVAP